jgi:hypothetical protein
VTTACTPGAIDPAVTQANLTSTVRKPDWRKKAYPPVTVDDRMRTDSARSYGLPLHEGVRKGMIPLATAQRALTASWITVADAAGLQPIGWLSGC